MVEVKEMLAPKGSAARPGYPMTPRYITIHNTANTKNGADAVNHGKYLSGAGAKQTVSYHYAVDDTCAVRIIPDTENAWHAGDGANGTGNRQSLSIEICENPESDLTRATDNAAELTARLMHDWNIPLSNVVQHNHWSGKNCPNRIRKGEPYGWTAFLSRVEAAYEAEKVHAEKPALAPPANVQKPVQQKTRKYLRLSRGDLVQLLHTADSLSLGICADLAIGPASPGDDHTICALADKLSLSYQEVD